MNFRSIKTAVSDFVEEMDLKTEEVDESLLKKWALGATKWILTDIQYEHKVILLNIENYKAKLPDDFMMVCEASYRYYRDDCSTKERRDRIVQWVQGTYDEDCHLEINAICSKCKKTNCSCDTGAVVVDVDRIWEMAHPEIYYRHYTKIGRFGYGKSVYNPKFNLLQYASNDFFGVGNHIPGCACLQCPECVETYRLNSPNIEVSFETGELLLAYLAVRTDENGDLMVPDHEDVFDAISNHLRHKWYLKLYTKSRDDKDFRDANFFKQEREVSIGRARSALQIPSFVEFSNWLKKNRYYKANSAYENLMENGRPFIQREYHTSRNKYKDY